jgi:5-methylthioadenosine/S-adenosylhomocysteine deaminase
MARRHRLPVTTHVLETPAQRAKAAVLYADHGGSMVRYMASIGLLGPGTALAHGVWLDDGEIALLAEHGASLVHNPMSNLKLKSGVAPIRRLHEAGVNLALGGDNCSCGDCQSLFQGMKLFCTLAALTDIAWMPLNSVARQLVFSETGRGVETTIVDGRIVMRDRRLLTIDEAAFGAELREVMQGFRRDFAQVVTRHAPIVPYLLEANRRVAAEPLGAYPFVRG